MRKIVRVGEITLDILAFEDDGETLKRIDLEPTVVSGDAIEAFLKDGYYQALIKLEEHINKSDATPQQ